MATYRIVRAKPHGHVTDAVVTALEDEVSKATGWPIEKAFSDAVQRVARSVPIPIKKHRDLFMVMMGPYRIPLNAADWSATKGKRVAWVFDVWPSSYADLATFAKRYKLDALFITAKQSADRMARALEGCQVKWCPEPLIDLGFKDKPWAERTVDVLQFGRKYEPYHNQLINQISPAKIRYVYEEKSGQVVYPTKTEFVLGLANAKVSVCFPCDLTHPERAGDVSTVTQRYFQSFSSGCVVVGQSPPELVQLFGYDPVVPADMANPGAQIEAILARPDGHLDLVRKNMAEVRHHSTAHRVEAILRDLA